ncbi:MAG: CAP domain-containing protein [bacterium]|nr:CAP domain-containing protein [bacterium]
MYSFIVLTIAAILGMPLPSAAMHQTNITSINREPVVLARTSTPVIKRRTRFAPPPSATTTIPATPPVTVIPVPQPLPSAPPVPPQSNVASQIEAAIFSLSNVERQKNGLAPLVVDSSLAQIARTHSADMLAKNYFSHTDLSGCGLSCRFETAHYYYSSIAENIHWMSGYNLDASGSAQKIVNDWMNSPGHRANILNGTFTNTGIGVAVLGSKIYSTTEFSIPR